MRSRKCLEPGLRGGTLERFVREGGRGDIGCPWPDPNRAGATLPSGRPITTAWMLHRTPIFAPGRLQPFHSTPIRVHQMPRESCAQPAAASIPSATRLPRTVVKDATPMAGLHKSEFQNPVLNWVDTRLPHPDADDEGIRQLPHAEELQLFLEFRRAGHDQPAGDDRHRHLPVDELQRQHCRCVRQRRADHARRELRLAAPLRARERRVSMFFIIIYIHIFRGMYYGSYKAPRELLWMTGVVLFLLLMATAFMGYVLPWGQMSYWGATVITNLFSAHSGGGQLDRDAALGRLLGGQSHAEPVLQPALPAAIRDHRRGVPACGGAAHHRIQQPAWGST